MGCLIYMPTPYMEPEGVYLANLAVNRAVKHYNERLTSWRDD